MISHSKKLLSSTRPAEKPSTGRLVSSASCRRRSSVLDEVVDGADDRDIVDKIVQSARCERQAERRGNRDNERQDYACQASLRGATSRGLLTFSAPCWLGFHLRFLEAMMAVDGHDAGDNEWEKADQPHWRGLGLTDPIKSVE